MLNHDKDSNLREFVVKERNRSGHPGPTYASANLALSIVSIKSDCTPINQKSILEGPYPTDGESAEADSYTHRCQRISLERHRSRSPRMARAAGSNPVDTEVCSDSNRTAPSSELQKAIGGMFRRTSRRNDLVAAVNPSNVDLPNDEIDKSAKAFDWCSAALRVPLASGLCVLDSSGGRVATTRISIWRS
jgi:hypothetical protein